MEVITLYEGEIHEICFVRGTRADVDIELSNLPDAEQKKAFALLVHVGDNGPPRNEQKCRRLKSEAGLFELKAGRLRMPFFYRFRSIVLTHLFIKPGEKIQQREVEYAARIRAEVERN